MARSKRSTSSAAARGRRLDLPTYLAARRRHRRRRAALAVAALAALVVADRAGLLLYRGDERSRYEGRTLAVAQVVSGDTLELDVPDGDRVTTRVRLWGISAPAPARPERGQSTAEPWADQAIAFVRRRIDGRAVRVDVEPHRLRDDAGRLLAHVYPASREPATSRRGELSLNAELLCAGLAEIDPRWSHGQLDAYERHEAQARAAGRGMWGDAPPTPTSDPRDP